LEKSVGSFLIICIRRWQLGCGWSQLRRAVETLILKRGMAGHFGAWPPLDFFKSGIAGQNRARLRYVFDFEGAAEPRVARFSLRPSASTSNGRAARQGYQWRNIFRTNCICGAESTKKFLSPSHF
jgi:hypothetical protein